MRKLIIVILTLVMLPMMANVAEAQNVAPATIKRVVVIDPGHGGPRPGKVMGKVKESDLVLEISKEVKRRVNARRPNVEVCLTRYSDSAYHANQVTDNRMRAEFANKKGADIAIGIHANAAENKNARGCEAWVLSLNQALMDQNSSRANLFADDGDQLDINNLDTKSMGFIKVLTRQLDNEPRNRGFAKQCCANMAKYGLKDLGVKSGKIWTMLYYLEGHGALVEVGYLTNDTDFKYITSEKGKKEIAGAIADAVVSFVDNLDALYSGDVGVVAEESAEQVEQTSNEASEPVAGEEKELDEGYAIQLISSTYEVDAKDYQFRAYKGRVRLLMGTGRYKYKYCFGSYASREAAKQDLKEVQKTFKDAYIVKYANGSIIQ